MLSFTVFIVMLGWVQSQIIGNSICPINSHGYIESSMITLSSTSLGNNGIGSIESQVYNYSLSGTFLNTPSVIIGITSFQSATSPYLMLSIKPLPTSSLSSLAFLLRFYYKYTNWKLITFSFLAEDRLDIQTNYYQVGKFINNADTKELSISRPGKAIQIQLPILSNFTSLQALYYLNGYEIATIQIANNTFSPFQIQAISLSKGQQSLSLVLSTTTQTQVYSLVISYLVFDNSKTWYTSGNYQYSSLIAATYLSLSLTLASSPSFIFAGITGFIISNTQGNTQLSTNFGNNSIEFLINPALNYLTLQYFIMYQPQTNCFFCEEAPYQYLSGCVATCPPNTTLINNVCTACIQNQIWNGTICVNRCTGGAIWNSTTQACDCPSYSNWNGQTCIFCPFGQTWQSLTLTCGCEISMYWNSYTCVPIPTCEGNKVYDVISFMCACPANTTWNGTYCTNCSQGYIWNLQSMSCICSNGSSFNGYQCITCLGGMIFDNINSICVCPANTIWNGSICINLCSLPFILTNGQCLCPPGTILNSNNCTTTPNCTTGLVWIGNQCQNISCIAGFIWNGSSCIQYIPSCTINSYWNGQSCVSYNLQCPIGSYWNGSYCLSEGNCTQGYYFANGQCIFFPQLCLPSYTWNGSACLLVGITACMEGQYYNGSACIDANCTNGKVWNTILVQCLCPSTTFWNGLGCVSCPPGQIYTSNGCNCYEGYFLVNGTCYNILQIYCSLVSYAKWNGQNCMCNTGFQAVGMNCICNGLISGTNCNRCFNIPNSQPVNGACQCNFGYYSSMGQCISLPKSNNSNQLIHCNPGTLIDSIHKICIPCSDGCLSCISQTVCLQCKLEYTYNWVTYSCNQICGDGKRFSLPCDDGNNINGDGCSSDCRIQPDYTCFGGSPNSPDFCTKYLPSQIILNLTGTTHMFGKVIANIRSNYLPSNITNPSTPCMQLCQSILQASVSGFNSYVSIETQYIVGSAGFSFSVVVDFQAEPIGQFKLIVGINPQISSIYFPAVSSIATFSFDINTAFLAMVTEKDQLN